MTRSLCCNQFISVHSEIGNVVNTEKALVDAAVRIFLPYFKEMSSLKVFKMLNINFPQEI